RLGCGKSPCSGLLLLLGERAQNLGLRLGLLLRLRSRRRAPLRRLLAQARLHGGRRRSFLRLLPRDGALSLLLDHHRLRPAVAELLLHVAGFDGALQAERLARACQHSLFGGFFRFAHTLPIPKRPWAALTWPPIRCSKPTRPTGIGSLGQPRSGNSSWRRLRSMQHVPHSTAPRPNSFARRSIPERWAPAFPIARKPPETGDPICRRR